MRGLFIISLVCLTLSACGSKNETCPVTELGENLVRFDCSGPSYEDAKRGFIASHPNLEEVSAIRIPVHGGVHLSWEEPPFDHWAWMVQFSDQ